jgi:hypothetical protein
MLIPGLDPDNKDTNLKFIATMADIMTKGNDDGLGYAALDKQGNLFGERWLLNHQAFDNREEYSKPRKVDKSKLSKIKMVLSGDVVDLEDVQTDSPSYKKYGTFGPTIDEFSSVILHTRRATNTVCYNNVHPFVDYKESTALIHNGVISNHKKEDEIRSTCDSERILNKYIEHGIAHNPMQIQKVIDDLDGYFACGIFSKDKSGRNVLDIFKSMQANLGCVFVKELDAMVFTTDINDVSNACYQLGYTIVSKSKNGFKEGVLLRLDAMTGKQLITVKWNRYNQHQYNRNTNQANAVDDNYKELVAEYNKKLLEEEANEITRRDKLAEDWTFKSSKVNNVLYIEQAPEHRFTESASQEEIELLKSGMTQQEIRQNNINKVTDELIALGNNRSNAIIQATKQVDEQATRKKIHNLVIDAGKKGAWSPAAMSKYESTLLARKGLVSVMEKANANYDPLNENKAAEEDFYWSTQYSVWQKRDNGKH